MAKNFFEELNGNDRNEQIKADRYSNMIGSLMYLANKTRPEISTSVGILSQHVAKPTTFLLKAVQRIFGYLKGTKTLGLIQRRQISPKFEYYCDSDYAGDRSERKSRTGWVALMNGCAFSWTSHKQTCVALSTAEAEYVAMSDCCKEIKWIRLFLTEIGIDQTYPSSLFSDNTAALGWAQNHKL
eukprot:IDg1266t1